MSPELLTLDETFAGYEAAAARVAATGSGTAELRALRLARIALCQALERAGWELPDEVRAQLLHDRTRLARGEGLVAA